MSPCGDLALELLADEAVQPRGQVRAAAVDADERHVPVGVLLDDLVGDPHERAADVVVVEDDLLLRHSRPSWPLGTGLKVSVR